MAANHVIVDHADGLHEGVNDGGADEFEAAAEKFFGHGARQFRFGRNLFHAAKAIDFGAAVDEIPEKFREAGAVFDYVEPGAGGADGAFDFQTIADDSGILHQPLDFFRCIAGNF